MLNPENYGKPISEEMANLLREFTSKDDMANVSIETNVGFEIIKKVVFRTANLTEKNEVAILKLMWVAVENCAKSIQSAKKAQIFFKRNLPKNYLA